MIIRCIRHILREIILSLIGGTLYMGIEILWRGRTHWSMGIVGGACFMLIGLLNEIYTYDEYMEIQALKSAVIVTIVEFVSGCIINLKLGWAVWDYSMLPLNILGQVCLLFTILWFFLTIPAIYLDDWIRYEWWGEPYPKYKWAILKIISVQKESES